ncbi:MAG: TonB-dependent receptor [Sandaracinobacter sp.]
MYDVRLARRASLLAAAALLATPAFAQTATGADSSQGVADIIVTAQKRDERLINVPVAISAFSANDIANRNVTTLDSLQASVPGLRLVDIGPGSQRIQLRGISQYQGLPTVGVYLDEFSVITLGAAGSAEIRLLDLERVEVLRGPQAALYGESSMGGTIRYIAASPDLTGFSGSALGEVSTVRDGANGYRLEGVVNAPLIDDKLGIRIAAARENLPGWVDGPLGDDRNGQDNTTIRGTLLFEPTPQLSIKLLGLYNNSEQWVKSYALPDRTTAQIVPSIANQEYWLGTLVVSYDAGPVTLLSSTGYLDQSSRSVDDSAQFYNNLFGAPLLKTAVTDAQGDFRKWSQEFRLTSNGSGPLRYLVGVSYSDNDLTGFTSGDGESNILPPELLGVVFTQDTAEFSSRAWAFFGNVAYDFGDKVTLDVGGRYFIDQRRVDTTFTLIGLPVPPSVTQEQGTFRSFNPSASLSVKTGSSGIVYARVAKGFRSGGFNQVTDPAIPPTFGPETLWTYEVGAKQTLIDGTLFIDTSVYYNDYTGIQANQLVNPTIATVVNAGNARGPGVDLTVQAKPIPDLGFQATLGYNNLRYRGQTLDRKPGDPADMVPDWTWSIALDYTPKLNDRVGLLAHFDMGFIDEARITIRSRTFNQTAFTQARAVANLRLGASFGNIDAYVYANNLFDENKIVNPAFGAFFEPTRTRPRTLGIGAQAHF